MKPAPFAYHAPQTVEEATALLAAHRDEDVRILAGGQSLVPMMAFRLARPNRLVDINNVAALDRLQTRDGWLEIGACVRHAALERAAPETGRLGALLAGVARHIGHAPIRTRGTFCGSLANADPASEWCLVAVTLGAELIVTSARGRRSAPADGFLESAMLTVLEPDELLTEARLPLLAADARFGFCETARRAGDFALAMALANYRLVNGRMSDVRLGVGAAEDRPRRVAAAEQALEGRRPGTEAFAAAAAAAAAAIEPLEDARIPAELRRELVAVMVTRALERSRT